MKRTAFRTRKVPITPADFQSAAPWDDLAETFEDRVSDSVVDYDDEREAMEVVLPGTLQSMN